MFVTIELFQIRSNYISFFKQISVQAQNLLYWSRRGLMRLQFVFKDGSANVIFAYRKFFFAC